MPAIVSDSGPFIHLKQINKIELFKKFSQIYTSCGVISEIRRGDSTLAKRILGWENLKVIPAYQISIPDKIRRVIRKFNLHPVEGEIISISSSLAGAIILTDDLAARRAAQKLKIEVHGSVGIISYSFHKKWITFSCAKKSLLLLQKKSSLFISEEIIKRAVESLASGS